MFLFIFYDIIKIDMEDNRRDKYKNYGENSAEEQLERVLNNPDGLEEKEKKEVEKKVFVQQPSEFGVGVKKGIFKDLDWYWQVIKKPVIILAGLEILVYGLSLFSELKLMMSEVFDPILLLVDFVFFGWIVWQVRIKKGETFWQGIVTVFLAGFALGLVMSIFKALWFREYWAIFNLITQPVFMGLVAVVIGLLVSIAIGRKRIKN